MQHHWLSKLEDNKKLIIFFNGFGFDYKPFEFLNCQGFDVLVFSDYRDLDLRINLKSDLKNYDEINLIGWSMGVLIAFLLRDELPEIARKIAINGTIKPVDNRLGIPKKVFELSVNQAKIGFDDKFYDYTYDSEVDYARYKQNPILRSLKDCATELLFLDELVKNTKIDYETFYDKALVSSLDTIMPAKNQINFHNQNNIPYLELECGHFPYYNFKNWDEIIKLCK
ncbi:MAG: DUF452 family protein [Candidatus Gastranaerophilales bacterium]